MRRVPGPVAISDLRLGDPEQVWRQHPRAEWPRSHDEQPSRDLLVVASVPSHVGHGNGQSATCLRVALLSIGACPRSGGSGVLQQDRSRESEHFIRIMHVGRYYFGDKLEDLRNLRMSMNSYGTISRALTQVIMNPRICIAGRPRVQMEPRVAEDTVSSTAFPFLY